MHEKGFDPLRDAIVEHHLDATKLTVGMGGTVARVNWTPNAQIWRTQTSLPRLMVLCEMWYPGWIAHVRHAGSTERWRPLEVYRTNYLVRGVMVPAGDNEIRFLYRPVSVMLGAIISAVVSATCLVLLARSLMQAHRAMKVS
jgi:hypothetical protein